MNSKTPTWAIVTAILMMLIGGCGIKNDLQSINIRELIRLKDTVFSKMGDKKEEKDSLSARDTLETMAHKDDTDTVGLSANKDSISTSVKNDEEKEAEEVKEFVGDMFDVPERVIQWIIKLGYAGLFFSLLYLFGGLFLLIKKKFSIRLVYVALGANILFNIFRWVMLSGEDVKGFVAMSTGITQAMGIFTALILLVVVSSCDKSAYEDQYTD